MTRRGALAVMALLCSLAACEDEPTPDIPDPTPSSTSPSVSESVSPTTPTETPEALTPEETVRAWVAARNQALRDGDTSAAEALSDPGCTTCAESLDPIRQVYAEGGHYETAGWRVASATQKGAAGASAVVTAGLIYAKGVTVPAAGETPVSYDVERHIAEFRLVRAADVWLVSFLGYLS